jgi:hypothetical protein
MWYSNMSSFLVSILIQSFCYSNSSQLILDLKLSYCVISFKKMRLSKVENIDKSMLAPGPITSLRFLPDCFSFTTFLQIFLSHRYLVLLLLQLQVDSLVHTLSIQEEYDVIANILRGISNPVYSFMSLE